MKRKYGFVAFLLAGILLAGMGLTGLYVRENEGTPAQKLTVVTSFYPMYVLALNIVGDTPDVTVQNLSENQTGCLHDYQLTPEDMKTLSSADVFVINGGGIESFLADVAANYPELTIINASENVELISSEKEHDHEEHDHEEHDHTEEVDADHNEADDDHTEHSHGTENAHAWLNIEDYMVQVQTVAQYLSELDSIHTKEYMSNAQDYLDKLTSLKSEAEAVVQLASGSEIISFHEAYDYVAKEYGMEVVYTMDLDEERQVSAGEVAEVVSAIKEHGIKVVLAEELYGKSMGDTVERETDAKVYYLDTLVRGTNLADSYLNGMKANIQLLKEAYAQ